MKGFIRILESIIASVILIASLAFFFGPFIRYTEWDTTLMQTEVKDSLVVLHKSGLLTQYVKDNDIAGLNDKLTELLPKTIDFSIEISGIPPPIIYIGCDCDAAEEADLIDILEPLNFKYRDRFIDIRIQRVAIASINDIEPNLHILFIPGYKDLNPDRVHIERFLENGGSIFMLSDLNQNEVEDHILNETFGLEWKKIGGGNPSHADKGIFYNITDPLKVSYRIARYFENLSGLSMDTRFYGFSSASDVDADNKTVVMDKPNPPGNPNPPGVAWGIRNRFSHVKVNYNIIKGSGRTVWVEEFDRTEGDLKNLTKAVVLWASGERYKMDAYEKDIPQIYKETRYFVPDKEPYAIYLIFWRVFY